MQGRVVPIVAALLMTIVPLALPSPVSAAPLCFGMPATYVMQPGEGQYLGTDATDVIVGSSGPDVISPSVTNESNDPDFVCSGGGDDDLNVQGYGSKIDGGRGNDKILAWGGAQGWGGTGNDTIGAWHGEAWGGTGNDEMRAIGRDSAVYGESGDDHLVAYTEGTAAYGGSGNDYVEGSRASLISGGSGHDTMHDSHNDTLVIDCGSGTDQVVGGGAAILRRCENVSPSSPDPVLN